MAAMFVSWGGLWAVHFLPVIRLDTALSSVLVGLTATGSVTGVIMIGLALSLVLALRPPVSLRRVLGEVLIHIAVLGTLLGGAALVNEYVIKLEMGIARPNIVELAEEDALGLTVDDFYTTMDKQERRRHLERRLHAPDFDAVALIPGVRDHWIHEAGYSFPSGHALSVMALATYYFVLTSLLATTARRRILHVLPVWAVLIAWSRVFLRVHRPEDVVWGGLLGLLLGAAASWLSWRALAGRGTPT